MLFLFDCDNGNICECCFLFSSFQNFMDTNNWRPTPPSGDWRTTLQPDWRQRIVNEITDTLKRHLPLSVEERLNELRSIAARFEEKIFTAADSQSDYLRRISLKLLAMETRSQNTMPNTGNNMASAGVQSSTGLQSGNGMPPVSGVSQNPISSVVGHNSNMQNMSGISHNSVGQGMLSDIYANQQRQMQGKQQQLQHQLMKQEIQQGNLQPSLMQQQNLLPPTQLQSGMQTSAMQSTPLPGLQQNQQSSLHQSTQSMLQQYQQSVLGQQQQPQQTASSGIQQQTPMTQQQQPHVMGQQNTIADMQQQRLLGQSSNLPNLQQQLQQLMALQNNLSNIHQQQLGSQSNISGLQNQQQLIGTQSGNSSMQTNQKSLHILSQPKVPLQQTQQTAPNLLPAQGQTSQQQLLSQMQSQSTQLQQLLSQMQSQFTQLQQQLGLQQHPNQVEQNMQQRLQAPGQTSNFLLQSQILIYQQKQLYQSQRAVPETSSNSTAQTGQANGGDWQEEVYQKIKVMKEKYLPELNEMHQTIAAKLQQHDSLPQQPKSKQLDKLKLFKTMLERMIHFLTVSKANIVPAYKKKLRTLEKQIIRFINSNRRRKPVSAMQQGQLPQSQTNQMQSHDNQMNPQLQPINLQDSMPTMQHNSLSSLPGASTAQQTTLNSLQPCSDLDPG